MGRNLNEMREWAFQYLLKNAFVEGQKWNRLTNRNQKKARVAAA